MNWDHAVSWGRGSGLALAILVGGVGHTGSGDWPTGIEKKHKTSVLLFWLGWWFDKITHVFRFAKKLKFLNKGGGSIS